MQLVLPQPRDIPQVGRETNASREPSLLPASFWLFEPFYRERSGLMLMSKKALTEKQNQEIISLRVVCGLCQVRAQPSFICLALENCWNEPQISGRPLLGPSCFCPTSFLCASQPNFCSSQSMLRRSEGSALHPHLVPWH